MKWFVVDFGTKSLKCLKLSVDGQRLNVEDFKTLPAKPEFYKGLAFPEPAAWTAIAAAFNQWEWTPVDEEAMLIAALPSSYLETRYLKFPFRSDKKIEKVLNFELESQLPFDIEEVQVRHHLLEGAGVTVSRRESLLLTMAYKRSHAKAFETELKKFQLTTPPMTTHSLALSALRQFIEQVPCYGLLEIGHSQSHLLLLQSSGTLLGVRTFWWGAKNLIEAIQEEYKVGQEKAEEIFRHLDLQKTPPKASQTSIRHFVSEIRQALKGLQGHGLKMPSPFPLYTFGRVAHYQAAMAIIEDGLRAEFQAEILHFPLQKMKTKNFQGLMQIEDLEAALPTIAMALSQTRNHRAKIATFSETSFQFQQNLKKLRSGSFTLLKRVAILLIVPFIYAALNVSIQTKENKKLLLELPRILSDADIPLDERKSTEEIADTLKKEVASNRSRIDQSQASPKSPLSAFEKLSRLIPTHLKIDMKELRITASTISFSAETNSNDTATRIVDILKGEFPTVKTGATTACANTQKTECRFFKVEVEREKS